MPAANTVNDVVSHPVYKKYILNTTNEDVERMRTFVSLHEHWPRVMKRMTSSELSVRIPSSTINGLDHYKECAWSDPDCQEGSGTCVCSTVSSECYDITQRLNRLWSNEE